MLLHCNLSFAGLQQLMCSHMIAQQGLHVGSTVARRTDNSNATDALNYDLAVVKLADSSIGYKTGWLGVAWDKKPYKGKIISAGYPGELVHCSNLLVKQVVVVV
jgi:hypothetical protein